MHSAFYNLRLDEINAISMKYDIEYMLQIKLKFEIKIINENGDVLALNFNILQLKD